MTSSSPTVTTTKATAYVSGTSIMWVALVELGIARVLEAWMLGFVDLVFEFSHIQVSLLTGFGSFLASIVRVWTLGPTAAVSAAWEGAAFSTFGLFAPFVVILEIIAIAAVATWAVRRL